MLSASISDLVCVDERYVSRIEARAQAQLCGPPAMFRKEMVWSSPDVPPHVLILMHSLMGTSKLETL